MPAQKSVSYKKAGVDVEKGDNLVDWLIATKDQKKSSKSKKPVRDYQSDVVSGIGGFAALFRASFQNYKAPLLVSSTDGVGTKVKLAAEFNRYEGIGQDLVAMCINDLACVGARPLFFLDYYAVAKLEMKAAQAFLNSVREACDFCECALIGGETAEMPGVYKKNDFDCAGFTVGVVDEPKVLGANRVRPGQKLIGVSSSGFHSNGYSLLRKVFHRDRKKWIDKLMTPTHLYSPLVQDLLSENLSLNAVAHVTGGGLDNLTRVIPSGTCLNLKGWAVPAEFCEVKARARLSWSEMVKTLNCGVGLALYCDSDDAAQIRRVVQKHNFNAIDLGYVDEDKKRSEPTWNLNFKELEG